MRHPGALPFAVLIMTALCLSGRAATPAQYDGALLQVQNALVIETASALYGGAPGTPALSISRVVARTLTPITAVERPGVPPQPVDNQFLIASIAAAARTHNVQQRVQQFRAIEAQITALRAEVQENAPARGHAPIGDNAAMAARSVLASNLYSSDPLPPPGLLDRAAAWLDRVLGHLFRSRHTATPTASPINPQFIKGLLIALLAGAFAVLVAVLVQWLRRRLPRSQPLALDETEAALVEARDTDSLRALADQKAQQGDYRLAIRFMYLALLVALDTDGVLRFDRSKTNWEYLRALRAAGRADVYAAMTPLTRDFDRIWYGSAPAHAADYEGAVQQFEALQSAPKSAGGTRQTASA